MIEFDGILEEMGRLGRHQRTQLCFLMIPGLLAAMHMASNVFIGAEMDHKCMYDGIPSLEQVSSALALFDLL